MRDDDTTPATHDATHADAVDASEPLPSAVPARETDGARRTRELDLPPHEAWPFIGTREGLEQWLGDQVDVDVAPGAHGTVSDGGELLLTEVESVEPGRRVSLRWWSAERGAAVVDLTLEPLDAGRSRLVVIEVPVRALAVPDAVPFTGGAGPSSTGPQLRAPRALALA